MPRTKCGLIPTILQFDTQVADVLLRALAEPSIPAEKLCHVISTLGRFHVSVSVRMIEHHRIRGAACPCLRDLHAAGVLAER